MLGPNLMPATIVRLAYNVYETVQGHLDGESNLSRDEIVAAIAAAIHMRIKVFARAERGRLFVHRN